MLGWISCSGSREVPLGVLLLARGREPDCLRVFVDVIVVARGVIGDEAFLLGAVDPQRSLSVRRCDDCVLDRVPLMMSGLSKMGCGSSSTNTESSLWCGSSLRGMYTQSTVRVAVASDDGSDVLWYVLWRTLRVDATAMLSDSEGEGDSEGAFRFAMHVHHQ